MNAYEALSISERFKISKLARETYKSYYGEIPEKHDIDHIDRNPFNNDPDNLRPLTRSENLRNRSKFTMRKGVKKSEYKGIYWCKRRCKWIAQLRYKGRTYYIGQYDNEVSAAEEWLAFRKLFNYER